MAKPVTVTSGDVDELLTRAEKAGISQSRLSYLSGVSHPTFNSYKNKRTLPSPGTFNLLHHVITREIARLQRSYE